MSKESSTPRGRAGPKECAPEVSRVHPSPQKGVLQAQSMPQFSCRNEAVLTAGFPLHR